MPPIITQRIDTHRAARRTQPIRLEEQDALVSEAVLPTMAARESKLRRLNDFRRALPHVSASALASLLEEIAEHGAPELRSRQDMHRATLAEMSKDTPYGPLMTDVELIDMKGTIFSMACISPIALLFSAYEQGGSFTELLDACTI